jgi:imidazolonepropionase-like amidohydrolase
MNIFVRTCAVALAMAPFQSSAPASLALTGGTVIDVRSGRSIADATILIRDDRILQVGRAADIHVPADARIVSVKDR